MKIFDCLTYFNEEEMLKIRLHETYFDIDVFVIVEASETFTGNKKPYYFDTIGDWIDPFLDKIIRVKIDFPEKRMTSWDREFFQRNSIIKGLKKAGGEDIIIVSDADEIINKNVIPKLKQLSNPIALDNKQYFWNFHWRVPDHCNEGARPVAFKYKHLRKNTAQCYREMNLPRIADAGWHFSYFSDIEKLIYKIESFAHTEFNKDEYKSINALKYKIENGIDPFGRFPLKYYDIDETYPDYVRNNFKL